MGSAQFRIGKISDKILQEFLGTEHLTSEYKQ